MNLALLLEVIQTFFCVGLLEKNKKMSNNIMFGALGNTWRYKFYIRTQNDMNLER